jgi:NAD(P)-dependent dehydrogenase (short-subunit alcohol dehydrogenase family)
LTPAGRLRPDACKCAPRSGRTGCRRSAAPLAGFQGTRGSASDIVYLPAEQTDAEETKRAVEAEGRSCLLLPGDVKSSAFCKEAVDRTAREFGRFDVLVNNAAYQMRQDSLTDITDDQLASTFHTNIFGYFFMARAALEYLKPGGCIINTGSITGLEGNKTLIDYASTKGAIHAFTKSLASSLADKGIRVNCVAPGPIWTPFIPTSGDAKTTAAHGSSTPMGRPGQPEEVAPAYVFFASEADSSYITGEIMTLLGGSIRAG